MENDSKLEISNNKIKVKLVHVLSLHLLTGLDFLIAVRSFL